MSSQSPPKIVFYMIDGLGDITYDSLNQKTPLQAAHTPHMDRLATLGINGLMDPVEPGLACGSDTAHMSIFGYDPRQHYRGRGSFETMGAGLDMQPGDIAFKCNFATCEPMVELNKEENGESDDKSGGGGGWRVTFRRADRNFEELGPTLCQYLERELNPFEFTFVSQNKNDDNGNEMKEEVKLTVEVAVKYATEHRCGIRVRGKNLSGDITGTDPLRDDLPLRVCEPESFARQDASAQMTSQMVNQLSDRIRQLLEKHPINEQRRLEGKNQANIVLFRGCGVRIQVPTFHELHGWKPFMVAPTAIIAGLGLSLGMDLVRVPGDTGDYHTDVMAQAVGFVEAMMNSDHDFGFCHCKVIDDAGHDGNIDLKIDFLQRVDEAIGHMWKMFTEVHKQRVVFVVTGDHSTPCYYKDHSFEPVPMLVCGNYAGAHKVADRVTRFEELDNGGFLGRFPGLETMKIIRNYQQVTAKLDDELDSATTL